MLETGLTHNEILIASADGLKDIINCNLFSVFNLLERFLLALTLE